MSLSSRDTPIVITGGAGFIGCNLAADLAQDGHQVLIVDDFSRAGVARNWHWLKDTFGDRISLRQATICEPGLAASVLENASAVYHFAAQVAVTSSLADPLHDFDVNLRGTLLWLDAIRALPRAIPFIFASTNKVYGPLADVLLEKEEEGWVPCNRDLRNHGINENRALDFHTPYGCSKGSADQYVLDYARHFAVPSTVLRMSCIYGPHQWGTEDQGWLAHFANAMLHGEAITLYGDGRQMRDVLYVGDAVKAYRAALDQIDHCSGQAFNLGGGPHNSVSLLTVIEHLEGLIGAAARIEFAPWRAGDQRWYVSDIAHIRHVLALPHPTSWRDGLRLMAEWIRDDRPVINHAGVRSCA